MMITNTIVNDRDVYDNLANDGYNSDSDDELDAESYDEGVEAEETTEEHATIKTPPPASKKRRIATPLSVGSTSSASVVSKSAKPSKFHLVEMVIDAPFDAIKSDPKHREDMNRLCIQANLIMQEIHGGDTIAPKYKDMRNGKETYFVKLASAGSD